MRCLEVSGGGGGGLGTFGRMIGALNGRTGRVASLVGGACPCEDDDDCEVVVGVFIVPANAGGCSDRSCMSRPRCCGCGGSFSRLVICG